VYELKVSLQLTGVYVCTCVYAGCLSVCGVCQIRFLFVAFLTVYYCESQENIGRLIIDCIS